MAELFSRYKATVTELDQAHEHRDSVAPPWPRISPEDLSDELIAQIEADHLKIPAVVEAQAKMDAATVDRDSILEKMITTAAKSVRGLMAKAKAADDAPDNYAEAMRASWLRDAEALAA